MSMEVKVLMCIGGFLGGCQMMAEVFLISTDKQGPSGGPLRHVGTQDLQGEGWSPPSHHLFSLTVVKACGLLAIWKILTPSLVLFFPPG